MKKNKANQEIQKAINLRRNGLEKRVYPNTCHTTNTNSNDLEKILSKQRNFGKYCIIFF